MRRALAAASFVLLAAAPPAATADDPCEGTVHEPVPGVYVVVAEVLGPDYILAMWIYHESNAVPGLQRGDSGALLRTDFCYEWPVPDTLVF